MPHCCIGNETREMSASHPMRNLILCGNTQANVSTNLNVTQTWLGLTIHLTAEGLGVKRYIEAQQALLVYLDDSMRPNFASRPKTVDCRWTCQSGEYAVLHQTQAIPWMV